MGKTTREIASEPTQEQLAQTKPLSTPLLDHSFTLQAVMEMQKTLGQLTQAVETLTQESKKNSDKIDKITLQIHGAKIAVYVIAGVLSLVFAFTAFLINKWESISSALKKLGIY